MSLAISVDKIEAVLLADGWHTVKDKSFDVDAYEYTANDGTMTLLAGGAVTGVPRTGASWTERDGTKVFCPLTAILAVKYAAAPKSKGKTNEKSVGRKTASTPRTPWI